MPKVLKSYTSNYKIAVKENGEITLDVGPEGTVFITGNLNIRGDSTAVNTTDLEIEDNIIVLNRAEDGSAGIPLGTSGIEINRGPFELNPRWIYDQNVSWLLGGQSGQGTFYAEQGEGGQKLPLNTPGIVAQGNFYIDTGNGVISVTNTPDYEEKIFNYENGEIQPSADGTFIIDDDNIPNAKAVKDFIDFNFATLQTQPSIQEGNTLVETIDELHPIIDILSINSDGEGVTAIQTRDPHGFVDTDTVSIEGIQGDAGLENLNATDIDIVEIVNPFVFRLDIDDPSANVDNYIENSGTIFKTGFEEPRIKFEVQGTNIANLYNNRFEIDGIEIKNTEISTVDSDSDLTLKSSGPGSVRIDDILEITAVPYDEDFNPVPLAPTEGIKLYSATQSIGKTGLYFVNADDVKDEIISKNRSLLFSMLF